MINWSIKGYPNDIEMLLTGIPSFKITLCTASSIAKETAKQINSKRNTSHAPHPQKKVEKAWILIPSDVSNRKCIFFQILFFLLQQNVLRKK